MTVFGNNEFCVGGNSAVHKFIAGRVSFYQVEIIESVYP